MSQPKIEDECPCGGSRARPNRDCERCNLVAEVDRLRGIERLAKKVVGHIGRRIPARLEFAIGDLAMAIAPQPFHDKVDEAMREFDGNGDAK